MPTPDGDGVALVTAPKNGKMSGISIPYVPQEDAQDTLWRIADQAWSLLKASRHYW